jgi:hypothetical protein
MQDLCRRGPPEEIISPIFQNFGNAIELMERTRKNGAKFRVCPPCADYFGANGDWMMKNIQDAWVVWF